jgi:AcrR family transcriptional regulator
MKKRRNPRTKPKPPPASDYHHGDLRAALIRAGLELLSQNQLGRLSLREVARRAKVSHSAPYRHFADKTELLAGLAEEGYHRFADAMAAGGAAAGDPYSAMAAIGEAYVNFGLANAELFHLMFDGRLTLSDYPGLLQASRRAYGVLVGAVQALPHVAAMDPAQREAFAVFQWAYAHGLTHLILKKQLGDLELGQIPPGKIFNHIQQTLTPSSH